MGKSKIQDLIWNPAGRIAILFFIFGFLWIFFSDRILSAIVDDPVRITELQTYKGWFFISVTTILIFFLVLNEINKKNQFIRLLNKKKNEFGSLLEEYTELSNEMRLVNKKLIELNKMLASSEEKYRSFFENINDGAFIYEYHDNLSQGRFIEVNQKLAAQLDYSHDEMLKKELIEIFFEGKNVMKDIRKQLKSKKSIQFDTILLTHGGKTIPFGISIFQLILLDKILLLGIARNNEERLRTINELTLAKEHAERANQLKDIFLSNISHEVRTPLNSIFGFSEILSASDLTLEKIQQYTNLIRNSSTELLKIISDILDLSRIESGQVECRRKPFLLPDLHNAIKKHLEDAVISSKKDLKISFNVNCEGIHTIISDINILHRVTTILIDNAVKFTNKGTISFLCQKLNNGRLQFSVSDTGIGIPQDKVNIIFDKFTQANGASTREYGGSGVGLAIARGLINILGGDITVNTEMGAGTTFIYYVPLIIES